jgi:hypothetical protein
MVRKGLSVRLERHIERGEELMELNRTAFDRNTRAFERVMAALDRHEQMAEEQKTFIRDTNRRSETVVQQIVRDHQEFMAKLNVRDTEADWKTEKILVELKDLREESKAQRQALLTLIDRLPPPAQTA